VLAACTDRTQEANALGAVAQQQLAAGNLGGAKRSITKAVAARDDIIDLQLLRGRIAFAQGSLEEAFDAYSDALSLDPTNGEALQGVSQLGLATGHLQESLEATDRILVLDPGQPDALLSRGIHALVRHRFDDAIGYADKILATNPANENASILKARALFLKGDAEAALSTVDTVNPDAQLSAGLALTKLELFRELRRPKDMQAQFAVLRRLRPDDLSLRLDEANLNFKLDDRVPAQTLVTQVLADSKASENAVRDAIQLWVNYGAQDVTPEELARIERTGTAFARQAVARLLIETGLLQRAAPIISSLGGTDRQGMAARLTVAQGDYTGALRITERVLAHDRTQCDALVASSSADLQLRRWDAALQSAQRAAAECPEEVSAWIANARAYQGLGRASGAERVYAQAFDAHPQDPRIVESYSEWLLSQKRAREALAIARRLTRNAPASLAAWRYYGELCRRTHSDCESEAARGLDDARTMFGIDLPVGAQAPNSLFGRFVRR
jgi:tetratricopeptide (TPR) repeat protein